MSIKEKTLEELEGKLDEIEDVIAEKGIGSSYLEKAKRVQRDVNLGLMLGGVATALGLTAWAVLAGRNN